MNFETVLFAAAFLMLALLTLPKGETAPEEATENIEINKPTANADALLENGDVSARALDADGVIIKTEETDAHVD